MTATTDKSPWDFRLTVMRHYSHVYRMSAALLRDAAEAEDVTQETFTKFWQHGRKVEKPREWLLKVAHNHCLDRLRKSNRMVAEAHEPASEDGDSHDPAWRYERKELAERLRCLIDTLPEPQRSLIVLFDLRGISGALCAEILELNENQVKVYLHRARRKLREKLETTS
jgi:RNA polymerase sigma-70 factor (ECF subfamily)